MLSSISVSQFFPHLLNWLWNPGSTEVIRSCAIASIAKMLSIECQDKDTVLTYLHSDPVSLFDSSSSSQV